MTGQEGEGGTIDRDDFRWMQRPGGRETENRGAPGRQKSGRRKYCSDACQCLAVAEWQREHKRDIIRFPKYAPKSNANAKTKKKFARIVCGLFDPIRHRPTAPIIADGSSANYYNV